MTRRISADEKATRSVSTPGGSQVVAVLNEAGQDVMPVGEMFSASLKVAGTPTRYPLPTPLPDRSVMRVGHRLRHKPLFFESQ